MAPTRLLGSLALLLMTTACSDDGTEPRESRLGRFELFRINGAPLPGFVTEGAAARIDFISGAVHLFSNGTFVDSTELKVTPKQGGITSFSTDVATGSYRISNDTVYFTSTRPGERYFMIYLTNQSLRQDLAGSILLYTR